MIKLIIFDHDMTIVDSSYAIMHGFNYVARHEGLPEVSHELTMRYIATPLPTFCEGLLGEYRPEWIKLYRQAGETVEREYIKPYPDTISTLEALHTRGIKTALASNREYPSTVLEREGILHLFDAVAGADEPYHMPYKPNPAMILDIMTRLNVTPESTIYIGDADIDILTAQNAGIRGVGITTGNFTHDDFRLLGAWMSIDTLSEILNAID